MHETPENKNLGIIKNPGFANLNLNYKNECNLGIVLLNDFNKSLYACLI